MMNTISSFFDICDKYSMIPTVEGLSLATHYDRTTLWDFETGRRNSEFADIVKNAKEIIKQYDAAMVANRNDSSERLCVPCKELLWNERCSRSNGSTKD